MTAAIVDPAPTTDPSHRVTVRPAPRREPPFDDEIPERHLTLVGPHDRPLPFAPSRRRLIDRRDAFSMQLTAPAGAAPQPRRVHRIARRSRSSRPAGLGSAGPAAIGARMRACRRRCGAVGGRPGRRQVSGDRRASGGAGWSVALRAAADRLALAPAGVAAPVAATAAVGIGTRLLLALRRLARGAGFGGVTVAARDPYLG